MRNERSHTRRQAARLARLEAGLCIDCGAVREIVAYRNCDRCRVQSIARGRLRRDRQRRDRDLGVYQTPRVRRPRVMADTLAVAPPEAPLQTMPRVYGAMEFEVVWPALGKADGVRGGALMPAYDSRSSLAACLDDTNVYGTQGGTRARVAAAPAINLVVKG